MRINNEIREYITKKVVEKSSAKRDELVAIYDRLNDANGREEEKKRDLLLRYLEQLRGETEKTFIKYANSIGFTFSHSELDNEFLSVCKWNCTKNGKYGNFKEIDAAKKDIDDFDKKVKDIIDEVLFKLSIGKDYDELMKEINSLKF